MLITNMLKDLKGIHNLIKREAEDTSIFIKPKIELEYTI